MTYIVALVYELVILSTDKKCKNVCVCTWREKDQRIMIKIEDYRRHHFWIVVLFNNLQMMRIARFISIIDRRTLNIEFWIVVNCICCMLGMRLYWYVITEM